MKGLIRKSFGIVFAFCCKASLAATIFLAGLALPALADIADEGMALGPIADHFLDRTGQLTIEQMVGAEGAARFVKANGRPANYGPRPNPEAVLWLRVQLPRLDHLREPAWSLSIDELRIRRVTLFIEGKGEGKGIEGRPLRASYIWNGEVLHRHNEVSATRYPVFLMDAEQISGAIAYLKIETASSMRALASLKPARVGMVDYAHEVLMFGLAFGLLGGLALYLLATGWAMKDRAALMLAAFALSYTFYLTSHQGLLETHLWPGSLDLSRVLSLSATGFIFATRLLFLDAFLELSRIRPWMSRITRAAGVLIIALSLWIAVDIALHGQTFLRKYTSMIGIAGLAWSLLVLAAAAPRVPWRVLIYILCWGPVIVSGVARLALDAFPGIRITPLSLNATYVFTCIGFLVSGVVTAVEMHRRERVLRKGLEAMRQRVNDIALSASDSFWETDETRRITYLSGPVGGYAGLALGAELSASLGRFEGAALLASKLTTAQPFALRLTGHGPDKAALTVELRGQPYLANDKGQFGFRGVISDITAEIRRQEQETRQQRLAAVGQLAGTIAHDINNLLHPIISLTRRAAADMEEGDRRRHWLDTVADAGGRAAEIVSGLLAGVRPAGQAEEASLAEGVRRALKQLQPVKPEGVVLTFEAEGDGPVMPVNEVFQIVVNLVSNAIYATHGNGRIDIRLSAPSDGAVRLSVADNGMGMDEETRSKALEPFYSGRGGGGSSTGLGLSIVNAIAKRQGGVVEIETVPGAGTRIILRLPERQQTGEEVLPHGA